MSEKKEFKSLDVGATERLPWELAKGLREYFHIDKDGNITLGANLEIDGTIKANTGIAPVFTSEFELQDNKGTYGCTLYDYGEYENTGLHLLYFSFDSGSSITIGFGTCDINNYGVALTILGVSVLDHEFQIVDLPNNDPGTIPTYTSIIADSQPKLYTHFLTLTAGTNSYVLMYDCTTGDELKVDSLQDLRTLMNVSSTNDNVILSVVNPTDLLTAGLQVTTSLCKIGTANVTTITDKVIVKA